MNTDIIQVVRGSPVRTVRTLGGVNAIVVSVIVIALWVFVKDSAVTRIAASVAIVGVAGVITLCACVAAATTIAEVRSGRLNFYFCGIRTRSIPLDASTTFELRTIGRLQVLSIRSSESNYVPNGALNIGEVADLLRANGVAERKAV